MVQEKLVFIEPIELYNILNNYTIYSNLSNSAYLLLLDTRSPNEFNESHVITSKRVPQNNDGSFQLPYEPELECKEYVVIYDGSTNSLESHENLAIQCGKFVSSLGCRNPVNILKGGYEDFSALYPFLRTQKTMFMPRELDNIMPYPLEIIPSFLYVGSASQANAVYIQKDLKIKAHVNCTIDQDQFFSTPGTQALQIPVEDDSSCNILQYLRAACSFLEEHSQNRANVLIYSTRGISRCITVAIAYLIYHNKWSLKTSWFYVKKCVFNMQPNQNFVRQLSTFEEEIHGSKHTDISTL